MNSLKSINIVLRPRIDKRFRFKIDYNLFPILPFVPSFTTTIITFYELHLHLRLSFTILRIKSQYYKETFSYSLIDKGLKWASHSSKCLSRYLWHDNAYIYF